MFAVATNPGARTDQARVRRVVVDLWYLPCVLLPLLACISSPVWYMALSQPPLSSIAAGVGFLGAGWIPWLLALMATAALADKYEVTRRPRGGTEADAWDTFAVRLLIVTGAIGVVLTLFLAGLVLSVATA